MDARDLQELVLESPATRTNHEWIQRPMDLPCCDDVQGMQPTRERGRLARIRPGKMETNPAMEGLLRSTREAAADGWLAPIRLRAGPATAPLRPRPWRSGRRGLRVLHRREPERLATAVHAGGTPALPGGVPLPIALAPREDTRCQRALKIAGLWAPKVAGDSPTRRPLQGIGRAIPGGVPLPIALAPRGDSLRHGLSSISLFFVWCR